MGTTDKVRPKKLTAWLSGALCFAVLLYGVPASWALDPGAQSAPDGEQLYHSYCAQCHEGQVKRAPIREVMSLSLIHI